jgi:hypothetical protein
MADITYAQLHQLLYGTPTLANQIEIAVVHESKLILALDSTKAPPVPPAEQSDEQRWATFANANSSRASEVFKWPCTLDGAIQQQALSALYGSAIEDIDVQRVVHNALPQVIADWAAQNPPPPEVASVSPAAPAAEEVTPESNDEPPVEQPEHEHRATAKKHRRAHAS